MSEMNDLRFEELVSNWLDEVISTEDSAEFQEALLASQKRRDAFAFACQLDTDMRLISETPEPMPSQVLLHSEEYFSRNAIRGIAAFASTVAVTLLMVVAIQLWSRSDNLRSDSPLVAEEETVDFGCAILSRHANAMFADGVKRLEGDSLQLGRLKLTSGTVQIEFFSGATLLMEEGAEVELISAWEARCLTGRVTVKVPPPAIGFKLKLPEVEIVDLGTEFGVEVHGEGSAVHVFDGEVEAYVQGEPKRVIREGGSFQRSNNESQLGHAQRELFLDTGTFDQQLSDGWQRQYDSWWDGMQKVRLDERLLALYSFEDPRISQWDRMVANNAIPLKASRSGSAVGARWVKGRWPSKNALEFKSPGDRVRLNLGKDSYDGLTMAAWVRIDGLDRRCNALMLTDGYEDGEPHWQILDSGEMLFSVNYGKPQPRNEMSGGLFPHNQLYRSPSLFPRHGTRRWHHVAVTFDARTGEAVQYYDGNEVSREINPHHPGKRKITFGACEIGNWGLPHELAGVPVRNLNGRVDEFIIYQEPLSPKEIAQLYKMGQTE